MSRSSKPVVPVLAAPPPPPPPSMKRQAIEAIIAASFRAGAESARLYRDPVEPIIEWDGLKPRITGYKVVV